MACASKRIGDRSPTEVEVELKETAPAHRFGSVQLLFGFPATFAYLRGYFSNTVGFTPRLPINGALRWSLSVHACAGHTHAGV